MTPGERYDFIINANQPVTSYWIRISGLMDWNSARVFQTAVLRYIGSQNAEPDETVTYDTSGRNSTVILEIFSINYKYSIHSSCRLPTRF